MRSKDLSNSKRDCRVSVGQRISVMLDEELCDLRPMQEDLRAGIVGRGNVF